MYTLTLQEKTVLESRVGATCEGHYAKSPLTSATVVAAQSARSRIACRWAKEGGER